MATFEYDFQNQKPSDLGLSRAHQLRLFWSGDSLRIENELYSDAPVIILWEDAKKEFKQLINSKGESLGWVEANIEFDTISREDLSSTQLEVVRFRPKTRIGKKRYKTCILKSTNSELELRVAYQKQPNPGPVTYYFPFLENLDGFPVRIEIIAGPDAGMSYSLLEVKTIPQNHSLFNPR